MVSDSTRETLSFGERDLLVYNCGSSAVVSGDYTKILDQQICLFGASIYIYHLRLLFCYHSRDGQGVDYL